MFSNVSRRYKNGTLVRNELIETDSTTKVELAI